MSFVPVLVSHPRLFTRQVLELWDYQWNEAQQSYDRVSFRVLHVSEPEGNPIDPFESGEFIPPMPISVRELEANVRSRMAPPRPPPPNFREESPASPDLSEVSPMDSPTKRTTPSPPPYSLDILACNRSLYVARQDHQYALLNGCPNDRPAITTVFEPANPALQPPPAPHASIRRRAQPPPVARGLAPQRTVPYPPPAAAAVPEVKGGRLPEPETCFLISFQISTLLHHLQHLLW